MEKLDDQEFGNIPSWENLLFTRRACQNWHNTWDKPRARKWLKHLEVIAVSSGTVRQFEMLPDNLPRGHCVFWPLDCCRYLQSGTLRLECFPPFHVSFKLLMLVSLRRCFRGFNRLQSLGPRVYSNARNPRHYKAWQCSPQLSEQEIDSIQP